MKPRSATPVPGVLYYVPHGSTVTEKDGAIIRPLTVRGLGRKA